MITFYKSLFASIYKTLESMGDDVLVNVDENRAFTVVAFITCFEVLNVLTFINNLERPFFYILSALIFGLNYLFFIRKNRFLRFVERPIPWIDILMVVIYIINTVIFFAVTR